MIDGLLDLPKMKLTAKGGNKTASVFLGDAVIYRVLEHKGITVRSQPAVATATEGKLTGNLYIIGGSEDLKGQCESEMWIEFGCLAENSKASNHAGDSSFPSCRMSAVCKICRRIKRSPGLVLYRYYCALPYPDVCRVDPS